ncbi:MAG TPA: response regulator transcription factor, partial [Acidimicrobiales bacterium]|nr:response regulator transcription factor [Acidimicrobiales bacterium]
MVVDDHEIVRAGLEVLLRPPYRVVASVGTASDAIAATSQVQPHIVLLDVRLPDCSGIDAVEPILKAAPRTRVVMLSTHEEPAWARAAVEAGAVGYLVKDADQ